jgi:hypothetical protein
MIIVCPPLSLLARRGVAEREPPPLLPAQILLLALEPVANCVASAKKRASEASETGELVLEAGVVRVKYSG